MVAGHFGLAAGIKKIAPRVPLWSLLVASFFLDVVFLFFAVGGFEKINPVDPANMAKQITLDMEWYAANYGPALDEYTKIISA